MPSERLSARALAAACGLAALMAACAAPDRAPQARPASAVAAAAPSAPARATASVLPSAAPISAASPAPNASPALDTLVGYAERVRSLPPGELAQEVQRLGDNGYTPLAATQLALALAQSRTAANAARAQAMLQRVQADASPEAQGLQPFVRLLSAQIADQRRADEAAERQAQQLRDAQRRIDQLNERLEALRAIERSLPGPSRREPGPPPR